MNILMVGPDSQAKGGMATVISNFKQYYQNENDQLFFLNSWSDKHKWRTEWQAICHIKKLIYKQQINVVHFHVAQKGSFFRKALLAKLVPKHCSIIFHMHASQFDVFYRNSSQILKKQIRKILNSVDHIVALSESWATFYLKITRTPVTVLTNAVLLPEMSLYNENTHNIVTLGRIGKRKGSYDILHIAKKIYPDFPEIRFILYGDGETREIESIIKSQGIANVILGGWIRKEEQKKVLQTAVLHLLPSYHEGLPMSILETMAAGIPNLATEIGGVPTVIQNGENGILVLPGDKKMLEIKLRSFLQSSELKRKYSANARKTIEKNFSLMSYFQDWKELYAMIVADKHKALSKN